MKPHRSGLDQSGILSCNTFSRSSYLQETRSADKAAENAPPSITREDVSHAGNSLDKSSSKPRSSKYYNEFSTFEQIFTREDLQPGKSSSRYDEYNSNDRVISSNPSHDQRQRQVTREIVQKDDYHDHLQRLVPQFSFQRDVYHDHLQRPVTKSKSSLQSDAYHDYHNLRDSHHRIRHSSHQRHEYDSSFKTPRNQHTDLLNSSMASRHGPGSSLARPSNYDVQTRTSRQEQMSRLRSSSSSSYSQDEDRTDTRHSRLEHDHRGRSSRELFHNQTLRINYSRQPHQVMSSSSTSRCQVNDQSNSSNGMVRPYNIASSTPSDEPTYRRAHQPVVVSHRAQRPIPPPPPPPPPPYRHPYLSDFSTSSESEVDSDYEYSETEVNCVPEKSELNIVKLTTEKSVSVQINDDVMIKTDQSDTDKTETEPSDDVKADTELSTTVQTDATDKLKTNAGLSNADNADTEKSVKNDVKLIKYERRLRRSVSEVFDSSGKIKKYSTDQVNFIGLFLRPDYYKCISSIDILSKTRKIEELKVRHNAKQAQLKKILPEFPKFDDNVGWGHGLYIKITRRCGYDTRPGQCRGRCLGKGTYQHRHVPFCLKPQCSDATCKRNHPFYFPNTDTVKLLPKDFSNLIIRHYNPDWFPIMLENQTKGLDPDVDIVCINLKNQFDRVKNPRKRGAPVRLSIRNKLRYLNDSLRRELVVLKWLNGQMPRYYRHQKQRLKLIRKVESFGEKEITKIIMELVGPEDWEDAQCVLENPEQFGEPATIMDAETFYKIWNVEDPYNHFDTRDRDLEHEPYVNHSSDDERIS